ncbi:unnamed protein product [Euphydryas editha]|uniref:Uncharacterized protein n=1 Tax=Euphydryas editha TaxID=104508 RepID=A0AAU9U7X0_EUPED|nr:unnamed protein product [Euphydryas editha]
MSTKNCSGCLAIIKNREYLQCPTCEQVFDIDCVNIPSKELKSMTVDSPITRSPTNTTISDDINDHTSSNVTLQQTKLKTLHDMVTKELNNMNQQFSSFHESLNFFNDYFENVKKELEDKSALQSSVNDLTQRLGALEQNMRENNVEVNGVPERKSENLINTFSQLAKSIQYPLADADVIHITRVGKLNQDNGRSRSFVVKMRSTRHRDALLAAVATYNKKWRHF